MQIPQATLNATQNSISFAPPQAAELIQQDNQTRPKIAPATNAESAQSQDFGGAKQEPQPTLYTRQGLVASETASSETVSSKAVSSKTVPSEAVSSEAVSSEAVSSEMAVTDAPEETDAISEKEVSEQAVAPTKNVAGKELTLEQQEELLQLQSRDQEVRVHEQQHASVGGQHTGSPSYDYETGPDGKQYVVEGSVPVNLSPVAGDPAATIDKMRQVKAAALAPAQPSSADKNAAAAAESLIAQATAELMQANQPNADDESTTDPASNAPTTSTPSTTAPSATASSSTDAATTKSVAKIATDTPTPKDANGQMGLRNQVIAGVYGQAAQKQSQQLLSLA